MEVLMSIKPRYAHAIFDRTKKFEFRKSLFAQKNVDTVVVYSSSPQKKIIGYFKIGKILADSPSKIWDLCHEFAGIGQDDFFTYFKDKDLAHAIQIKSVTKFDEEIDPRAITPEFRPPQSYCYLKPDNVILKNLKHRL